MYRQITSTASVPPVLTAAQLEAAASAVVKGKNGMAAYMRTGLGDIEPAKWWGLWDYYPPPYTGLYRTRPGVPGMGCAAGEPCKCGGACQRGMGQLFDSPFDLSSWGWPEWAIVGLGAFALYSFFSTTTRAVKRVRRTVRRSRSRARRKAQLEQELSGL